MPRETFTEFELTRELRSLICEAPVTSEACFPAAPEGESQVALENQTILLPGHAGPKHKHSRNCKLARRCFGGSGKIHLQHICFLVWIRGKVGPIAQDIHLPPIPGPSNTSSSWHYFARYVNHSKTEKNISSGDLICIISELAENCFNLIIPIRISATWRFSLTGLSLKKNSLATSAALIPENTNLQFLRPLFHRISSYIWWKW